MKIFTYSSNEEIAIILNSKDLDIGKDFEVEKLMKFAQEEFLKEIDMNKIFQTPYINIVEAMEKYFGNFNKRAETIMRGVSEFCVKDSISISWIKDNIDKINKELGDGFISIYKPQFSLEKDMKEIEELFLLNSLAKLSGKYKTIFRGNLSGEQYSEKVKLYKEIDKTLFIICDWKKKYLLENRRHITFRKNVNVNKINRFKNLISNENILNDKLKKSILLNSSYDFNVWIDKKINVYTDKLKDLKKEAPSFCTEELIVIIDRKIEDLKKAKDIYFYLINAIKI